jgi:hypothetical protein
MSEEKEQIGFLVSKQYADQFREMAKDDRRNLSAQFELFVEREWERRQLVPKHNQEKSA